MFIQLQWNKCAGNVWCALNSVNLAHPAFNNAYGVYVIWHGGPTPRTVYVGIGNIQERLQAHRSEPQIQQYANLGLFVTWAAIAPAQTLGAELYLAQTLRPLVGQHTQTVAPVQVTLPW